MPKENKMISIYTVHYNRVDLLILQHTQIHKFCNEEYDYIVVNNGIDTFTKMAISEYCRVNNLKEITISDNKAVLNTAMNHKTALQYCYDNFIISDKSELRVVMDSDCIPYTYFTFKNFIKDKDIAGIKLGIGNSYIASFISIFSKNVDLTGFDLGVTIEFDSGASTHKLVEKYSTQWLDHTAPIKEEEGKYIFRNTEYDASFNIQFIEKCFVHYYRGTGWDYGDLNYILRKHKFVSSLIVNIDKYDIVLDEHVHYDTAFMDQWINKEKYRLHVKLSNISN